MTPLLKKVVFSLVTFSVLFSSVVAPFASVPTASAQDYACDELEKPNEHYCRGSVDPPLVGAVAACEVADIAGIFGSTTDPTTLALCQTVAYYMNKAIFASPIPSRWYDTSLFEFSRRVFDSNNTDEIFGERYTYAQVNWIISSIIVYIFPPLRYTSIIELLTFVSQIIMGVGNAGNVFGDASPILESLPKLGIIGGTYAIMAQVPNFIFVSPIASGVTEVKNLAAKFNIASPASAQGLGYEKLNLGTVRDMWVATRNMAYLIATIILIVAGLMVIFRTKISPQASVTVQMIIPRLVISLVLVTFSFAIVGFVIDMMYVIITAVLGMISFTTGTRIISDLSLAISNLTGSFNFVQHFLGVYIAIAVILMLLAIVIAFVAVLAPGAAVIIPISGIILGFFMWSVYLWARIVGQLIVAYITLMLLTIAGPIMIIMDILPTSKGGFKKWLSCVIGNASVFVSYALISILIFMMFANTNAGFFGSNTGFTNGPHIRANYNLPLFTGGSTRGDFFLQYFIFMGFMSIVPNLVSAIKNLFCKTSDFSNFMENTVKDTFGQFSKAGQEAGKTGGEWVERRRSGGTATTKAADEQATLKTEKTNTDVQ
jgi:hypothetical protein